MATRGRWCPDPYVNRITFMDPTRHIPVPVSYATWEEAHAHLVSMRESNLRTANKNLNGAKARLKFVLTMKAPES